MSRVWSDESRPLSDLEPWFLSSPAVALGVFAGLTVLAFTARHLYAAVGFAALAGCCVPHLDDCLAVAFNASPLSFPSGYSSGGALNGATEPVVDMERPGDLPLAGAVTGSMRHMERT